VCVVKISSFISGTTIPLSQFSLPQNIADKIGKLVMDKFAEIIVGQTQHSRRKVLAGVIMSKDEAMDELEVISVTTGTKCVNGEHMSVNGNSLNGTFCILAACFAALRFYRKKKLGKKSKNRF
jgi:double stranded RNA-specific editase B